MLSEMSHASVIAVLFARANRDKETLETKLHRGSASILKQHAAPLFAVPPSGKELHGIEDLRKRNFELEQEVSSFVVAFVVKIFLAIYFNRM